jgi:hypothetical protein
MAVVPILQLSSNSPKVSRKLLPSERNKKKKTTRVLLKSTTKREDKMKQIIIYQQGSGSGFSPRIPGLK